MHHVYLSLALALAALAAAPTLAQPNPPASTAPALYKHAVKNLDDGHWFESAITDLTKAVKLVPDNSDYHLALGCAEVNRAGSIAYAAFMTDQLLNAQAQYTQDYTAWQAAQQDPKADDYGKPAPVPPPMGLHFRTKDDLTHLKLTGKQALAQVVALGTAAQGEWRQAVALAKTPPARAQAESVQGWGLQYELNLLSDTGYADRHIPGAPKPDDAIAAFTAATKDDPTNGTYWESLGDACTDSGSGRSRETDAIQAWQQALALRPGNTGLLFRLYTVQAKADPKAAMETLKALAASDPGNSFLQYGLAAQLFKQVNYSDVTDRPAPVSDGQNWTTQQWHSHIIQELAAKDNAVNEQTASNAVDAIERGNAGTRFEIPEYTPPVPKILWHAWDYWHHFQGGEDFHLNAAGLRELARATNGYALVAVQRGDESGAIRAARACIGMGTKIAGDWPIRNTQPDGRQVMQSLVGFAIESIGDRTLQTIYEQSGDTAMAQAATAESEALKQRYIAYTTAVKQALINDAATDSGYLFNNY